MNETYEICPLDFLAWFDSQAGKGAWCGLPQAMTVELRASGSDDTGENATISSGVENRCRDYLAGEMRKSMDRQPKPKREYWKACENKFQGLGTREFKRAWKAAISMTGCTWGKAGRPANHS